MLRTHNCGDLRLADEGRTVTLSGWVQRSRDLGGMTFIDLRDRYGITQLLFNMESDRVLCEKARQLGREYVIQATGTVSERSNKNPEISTGDIEVAVERLDVLSSSKTPPFTIEDETDGGEELRMRYRALDIRRSPLLSNLTLRHQMAMEIRKYLSDQGFLEIETPVLIKSTPEGARDFVVPSRIDAGAFYALPQSPQTFKQLLMIGGLDRYFQIVKCFRDEDLRADRQPEFTQVDLELSFVERDDVLELIEGLVRQVFRGVLGVDTGDFPVMSYETAMARYGTDRPDTRFDMTIVELSDLTKGSGFKVFDRAEYVGGICAKGCGDHSRKQLDALTDFVTSPQIGANGLVYVKYQADGTFKSSVDKFFGAEDLKTWAEKMGAEEGDLMLILAGEKKRTLNALGELRIEMGNQLGLRDPGRFEPLWIVDFPLFEWNEEEERHDPMHHPFTAPHPDDRELLNKDPGNVRANAYDLVINGVELGGGSIRIHERELQESVLEKAGFTRSEAIERFGFLLETLEYGAPPHGGVAFGFDRWVALFAGDSDIRNTIAFPKNNAGRDLMIGAPSELSEEQLRELHIQVQKDRSKTDTVPNEKH